MKNKIAVLLLSLIIALISVVPAFAEDGFAGEYLRCQDFADILTEEDKQQINDMLDEISIRQKLDVTAAVVESLDGYSAQTYADEMYEEYLFGYGTSRDGVLLLISIGDSEWHISTCGYGITVFTDAGIEYIGNKIKSDLSSSDYAGAIKQYAELCDTFTTQARTDKPYDSKNLPKEPLSVIWIPISIAAGVIIALIIVAGMKSKLKTVHAQSAANSYLKDGSLNITERRDLFLYNTVDRREKPKENDSSNGSSSSTHTSSSGTTHGGGGGKF